MPNEEWKQKVDDFVAGEPVVHDQAYLDKKDADLKELQDAVRKKAKRMELINPGDAPFPLEVEDAERLAEEVKDVPDEELTIEVLQGAMDKLGIVKKEVT